ILLTVLELFAGSYISAFSLPQTHYDYRKEQPEPYTDAAYKYVFFLCPGIEAGTYQSKSTNDVTVWSIGD
ncbi:MAG: hypothetical protein GY834_11850, partial [Bacteroidetes bacterium]|nr:hypothetical protein [Bacteroidota bacterium]